MSENKIVFWISWWFTGITPSKSNNLNQAAKRPPRTGFDISKARKELGYNPHSFEEGLKILDRQLNSNS